MASQAVRAHGTLLQSSNGVGGWVTIAEQVNIDYSSSREEINISIHNEPDANTNWLPGPMNTEIGLTCNFLGNDLTHQQLFTLFAEGLKHQYRIAWLTFTPARFCAFTAFPRQWNIPAPAGEPAALQFNTTMRIDGAVTWT